MLLSALMVICADVSMTCEIRTKYEMVSTQSVELCTVAADTAIQRRLVKDQVTGWSHGQCFPRKVYAKTVEAAAKSLQENGYTVSFFFN